MFIITNSLIVVIIIIVIIIMEYISTQKSYNFSLVPFLQVILALHFDYYMIRKMITTRHIVHAY